MFAYDMSGGFVSAIYTDDRHLNGGTPSSIVPINGGFTPSMWNMKMDTDAKVLTVYELYGPNFTSLSYTTSDKFIRINGAKSSFMSETAFKGSFISDGDYWSVYSIANEPHLATFTIGPASNYTTYWIHYGDTW